MKRPVHHLVAIACLAVSVPAVAQRGPAPSAGAIRIPFERYTLQNGLTVILAQDHSTPTVAVEVLYHVGSKNEQVGRTGFAHLFEHVMFTGSGHVPYGLHDKYTEGVGGGNNGNTTNDFTQYYEDWLTRGIPDPRAELLHVSPDVDNKYVVYRWRRPG